MFCCYPCDLCACIHGQVGRVLSSSADLVFEQNLVNDSSANTSTEEANEDTLACL